MKKRCFSSFLQKWDVGRKILLTMKLTCVLTVFFTISAMGVGIGQTVNLKLKDVTLREAFKALKQQTGMYFVYNEEACQAVLLTMKMKRFHINSGLNFQNLRVDPIFVVLYHQLW